MGKPTKAAIKSLMGVVGKLENWQRSFGNFDTASLSTAAKNDLMRLMRKMEDAREEAGLKPVW